jgi:tetratricopeptide (TPR) repeat protein
MTDQTLIKDKIKEYRKALLQDPKSMVFVPLAIYYLKSGMLDDALEVALRGTWELPDYPPGYVVVGRVYAQRDVHEKSIAAFQKAIEIDPSCLDAYKLMARTYREQGNIDAAINLLTNAVFIFPDENSLKLMLESLAPVSADQPPTTVESVEPLSIEDTAKPITTATIAEIYIEQGLYSKALEVYRELFEKTKSVEVAKKIAEIEILDQGGAAQSTTSEVLPDVAPFPNPSVEIEPAPAAPQSSGVAPVSERSVLDTLNGMLTYIQSRRNRV